MAACHLCLPWKLIAKVPLNFVGDPEMKELYED